MNLLAFSRGEYLDRLGDLTGTTRLPASKAMTTVEVKLSAARETSTIINKGTRVTADDKIYFALDEALIFAAGETVKTCAATCTEAGEIGNGFAPNELNKIVDPQPFLKSITNTTTSAGGADIESDDSLRDRIHESPESYSVAGPEGSYIFHAKSVSPTITDVAVDSPSPGLVDVFILTKDGLPNTELLDAVDAYLNKKTVRPLTDWVHVLAPTVENYEVDISYYINRSDAVYAAQIVSAAEAAVDEYVEYQGAAIGRDINPDELIARLKQAGVKRAEIRSPQFKAIGNYSVAVCTGSTVTFAGLEEK
ncbi:MAG: baseplate J/gp47 family protein [Selenomonadaceae bacterium]|nr:baseplate J/gp47 family protein [Selenomonadaceae bacterium]